MQIRLLVHLAVLGAGLLLFAAQLHGQAGTPPREFEIVRVTDDIFALHNPGAPGNIAGLVTDEGVILVDGKNPVDYDNVVAAVRAITDKPIRYVVNTHHHGDHTGSNAALLEGGAVIIASENQRQNMIQSGYSAQPSITFEQRANVMLGGKTVELHYFGRGHTNGDIVAYFREQRVVATGDLYVTGRGTPELIDYAAGGSAKEWTRTLDRMLELDFDTAIPGHGVVADKNDVRRFRELTVALRTRVHEMLLAKATADEIEAMLRTEFGWGNLHVARGLLGVMAEMRQMP